MKILPIGDSHAKPGVSNDRYVWLGKFIVDHQPDVLVDMGDWFDMPSLSSYDKYKKNFEGRRYSNDIAIGNNAIDLVEQEISRYNRSRKDRKIAQYRPRRVKCMGNHEERIMRAVQMHPELDGKMSYNDFKFKEHGWEYHDYMKGVVIEDVVFSHCVGSGIENRPISGENPALALLQKKFCSCVVGHTHLRDMAERTTETGRKLCGLVVGCYLAPEQYEDYAGSANQLWWKGLVLMNNVKAGYFDTDWWNIERVKATYA